jgi:hypothetical protein
MAIPTNLNTGPTATGGVGGVINHPSKGGFFGALVPLVFQQGTDLAADITDGVACEIRAPFAGIVREGSVFAYDVTGTTSGDIYNVTTSVVIAADQTLTDATSARVTTFTTSTFAEGDRLQFRITTAASTGACKGAQFILWVIATADSASNPNI